MSDDKFNMLRDMPDRTKVERFYDDSVIYVGWKDTREALVIVGANTELNRQLGDFIAKSIREIPPKR